LSLVRVIEESFGVNASFLDTGRGLLEFCGKAFFWCEIFNWIGLISRSNNSGAPKI